MRTEPQVVSSMKMYGYIYILEENVLLITVCVVPRCHWKFFVDSEGSSTYIHIKRSLESYKTMINKKRWGYPDSVVDTVKCSADCW